MNDASAAADIFRRAAELNRSDPLREGSLLRFPNYGQLVMTGDMHGHQRNFQKLKAFCDLEHAPVRHVMLHELIHEEPVTPRDQDLSHLLALEAAKWKCEFPDQIHFLQSNHELAQLTDSEISKGGRIVTRAFEEGVISTYSADGWEVVEAIRDFIASFPLAGRTPNRIFLSHSLPGMRDLAGFDLSIFERNPTPFDLSTQGSAYALVWGRYQTAEALDYLAQRLDVDLFITGHQPQEFGHAVVADRMLILASDHNHGVFLPFDLKKKYKMEDLVSLLRPFAGVDDSGTANEG
ncbi:MAG TPA: hypothetical protein VGM03_06800 [Phycisphaerae bacterium]